MENVKEKVAYLKGLMDGLDIDKDSKEGKLFKAIIETLDDMAESIILLEENQNELDEYVDTMDQDLARLEDDIYESDEDEDYDDEEGYIEVECPNCHETVYLDEEMLDDEDEEEIICPNCNQPIYFDCGCDCDNEHDDCNCTEE